ncbi:MAG: IS110 family transposase [Neomegalonema sp.]|nr:IS110 family transposase [Neomegalonema sp.]
MAYVAGLDWGGATHAVCVIDKGSGAVMDRFEAVHDRKGLAEMVRRLARLAPPADLAISIERPSGLIVEVLVEAGHPVVPVHPNAVKAARARRRARTGCGS